MIGVAFITSLLFAGFMLGVIHGKDFNEDKFEELTGINWYSFQAAHDDCEAHFKTDCRLENGFRPKGAE